MSRYAQVETKEDQLTVQIYCYHGSMFPPSPPPPLPGQESDNPSWKARPSISHADVSILAMMNATMNKRGLEDKNAR